MGRCVPWGARAAAAPRRHAPPTRSQAFQSVSSFILSSYSELLQQHTVVVMFLTMLVGAGGNAGNQSAVLVIRGLATGEIREWTRYICGEVKMAVAISIIMVGAGFARVVGAASLPLASPPRPRRGGLGSARSSLSDLRW